MKILITGGAGFIGSNIADVLTAKGHKVAVVDNLSSGRKENLHKKVKFYKADICDDKNILNIFKKEKPEVVIHNAAQIDVYKSVLNPVYDAGINILGSLNILQACVANKTKKIIFASSGGAIYGECLKKAADENASANPLSPYGIAKYAFERYIKFYSEMYGLKYTILRYSNVYGPKQDQKGEAGVISIFARRMLAGLPVTIFGSGEQTRDYVYVGDVAEANVKALKSGDNQIVNIATNTSLSVNGLLKLMSKMINCRAGAVYKPKRDGDIFKSVLDIKKASKVFRWKPETGIEEGLKKTIGYFNKDITGEVKC